MMDFSELMEIVWETKMRLGLSDASTATPSGYGEYFTNTLNIFAEFARKFSPRSFLDGLNAQFLSSYGRSLQVYVASVYNETLPRVALPVKRYLGDFDARAYWMRVRNDLENAANVAFESGHEMALKIRWTEPECLTWLIIASVVIIGFLMVRFFVDYFCNLSFLYIRVCLFLLLYIVDFVFNAYSILP